MDYGVVFASNVYEFSEIQQRCLRVLGKSKFAKVRKSKLLKIVVQNPDFT